MWSSKKSTILHSPLLTKAVDMQLLSLYLWLCLNTTQSKNNYSTDRSYFHICYPPLKTVKQLIGKALIIGFVSATDKLLKCFPYFCYIHIRKLPIITRLLSLLWISWECHHNFIYWFMILNIKENISYIKKREKKNPVHGIRRITTTSRQVWAP